MPEEALVVISGCDDLIHAEEVRQYVKVWTKARILYHETHTHAGLLLDPPWQVRCTVRLRAHSHFIHFPSPSLSGSHCIRDLAYAQGQRFVGVEDLALNP